MGSSNTDIDLVPLNEVSDDDNERMVDATCDILCAQWPQPSRARRRAGLMLSSSSSKLPTSLVLIQKQQGRRSSSDQILLGHVRINHHTKVGGDCDRVTCIVTSVVIARPHRGHGYGRLLLERTAAYARALGFGRVVLWTSDQACFYQRCGYVPCRPLNLVAPVVASMLNANSLSSLQRILAQRQHSNDSVIQNADDNEDQDNPLTSIWLHKRLIPFFPPFRMPRATCETDVITQLQRQRVNSFRCLLLDVPNETQIGPCCGIAALRCLYQYFVRTNNDQKPNLLGHSTAADSKDLVQVARDAGYSIDGEMFQATNLAALATAHLHLPVQVVTNLSAVELCQHIHGGRLILVPFDKNMTDLEHAVGLNGGRHAHWGVVRGVAVPTTTANDSTAATRIVWHPDTIVVNHVEKNVFVIVQHTNHDRLVVVPWQRLHDSNAQVDDCGDKDDGRQALSLQIQPRQLAGQWLVVSAPSDSRNGTEGP